MVITYYGASCFKIQSGDMILVFDPPSKKSEFKTPRFQADIVCVSHDHVNHSGFENIPSKEKDAPPFLISGPGEYEIRGVSIKGIKTFHDASGGKKYGLNTAYLVSLENMNICHFGDFGENELRPEVQENLGEADILFVSIDGAMIEPEQAVKLMNQIEPKITIPMHYFTKDFKIDKKCLSDFLKEAGREKIIPVEKLTLHRKDISNKKEEVAVLTPLIN